MGGFKVAERNRVMKHAIIVKPPDPAGFERARIEFGQALMASVEVAMRVAEKLRAFYMHFPPGPDPSWTNEQVNAWLFKVRP